MVRVKICGITNWTDARLAVKAGADALGFNFYRKSPRYIAPDAARLIATRLPRRVLLVGIFVNTAADDVLRIARNVDLNVVQLHGEESPADVRIAERIVSGDQSVSSGARISREAAGAISRRERIFARWLRSQAARRNRQDFDWQSGARSEETRRDYRGGRIESGECGRWRFARRGRLAWIFAAAWNRRPGKKIRSGSGR